MNSTMSSRKFQHRISFGFLMWMIVLATLLSGSGVYYAILKNSQLGVSREIDRMRDEIAALDLARDQYKAKVSMRTNRWAIRDRLAQDRSALVEIDPSQIEVMQPEHCRNVAMNR